MARADLHTGIRAYQQSPRSWRRTSSRSDSASSPRAAVHRRRAVESKDLVILTILFDERAESPAPARYTGRSDPRRTMKDVSESLQIAALDPSAYPHWDRFCLESSEAWFWHTSHWLEYTLHYRPDLQPRSLSFSVQQNGQVLGICPLIVECYPGAESSAMEFSYGSDCGPAPVFADGLHEKTRKIANRTLFAHLDKLAAENAVQRASFRWSPPASSFWNSATPPVNPLLRLGFSDISLATRVLDLGPHEEALLRDMRKGHRADINRAGKLLQAEVLDQHTVTLDKFEEYRHLHAKAAGRVTRPLETFQLMHDWIRQGLAILCRATLENRLVGAALISVFKDGAYYSSSCEDPEYNHLPIGHILQWEAIRWLKLHGVRRYEMGLQVFGSQAHMTVSEKETKIAFFKRGFGGKTVPFWRGEKFYSRDYCLRVLNERIRAYADGLPELARG